MNPSPPSSDNKQAAPKRETRTWFPIPNPFLICSCYIVVFLVFVALGIVMLIMNLDSVEVEVEYTNDCTMVRNNSTGASSCTISSKAIQIPKNMKAPIYIYYKLENVYQNFRKYVSNLNDAQLSGSDSTTLSGCDPYRTFGTNSTRFYNPCGTIAYSMFNDTFRFYNSTGTLCDGVKGSSTCSKSKIAWSVDRENRYKLPSNPQDEKWVMNGTSYYNETGHAVPLTTDEDLMVWMRLAALPTFKKLYRVLEVDLAAGEYYFEINQRWPIGLGVKKKLVIATMTWFGGRNMFLAIAYLSVSGVCLFFGVVFVIAAIINMFRESRIRSEIAQAQVNEKRKSARSMRALK